MHLRLTFDPEKITEIKRNNQHLLDKLLEISNGKRCPVNQKNIKVEKGASKSLNYTSKKREAERIDRENKRILDRIINVKPNLSMQTKKLSKDYYHNHILKKRMLQNHGGVNIDEMIGQ